MPAVPDRWRNYSTIGKVISSTKLIPFKVPLKKDIVSRHLPENEWFTPDILLQEIPNLRAIIDLTQTSRYYNSQEEFISKGILYRKISVPGRGIMPPKHKIDEFFDAVDEFLQTLQHDPNALIGVHCTHGLNRTGYLICKYMVSRMKIDPNQAIKSFQQARGYPIERQTYINDLKKNLNERSNVSKESRRTNYSQKNWRLEERTQPRHF